MVRHPEERYTQGSRVSDGHQPRVPLLTAAPEATSAQIQKTISNVVMRWRRGEGKLVAEDAWSGDSMTRELGRLLETNKTGDQV